MRGSNDDFQGFDQFGNPLNKSRIPRNPNFPGNNKPFNPNPFGGNGGFGSGFGGGFNNFF